MELITKTRSFQDFRKDSVHHPAHNKIQTSTHNLKKSNSLPCICGVTEVSPVAHKQSTSQDWIIKSEFLKSLKALSLDPSEITIKSCLQSVFDAGLKGCVFNDDEQNFVAVTLKDHLKEIFSFILRYGYFYNPALISNLLTIRSAIQFMSDEFGSFRTADNEKLITGLVSFQSNSEALKIIEKHRKI